MLPASALLVAVLSASPTPAPTGPIKLAAPGFKVIGLGAAEAEFLNDLFAQKLELEGGLQVSTASEIASLLGHERQKQLLGCAEDATSCMAEVAGALGAEGIVTGQIGRLGRRFTVNVNVVDARDGKTLALFGSEAADYDEVVEQLGKGAKEIAVSLRKKLRPDAERPEVAVQTGGGAARYAFVPFIAAGAAAIGGGVMLGMAKSTEGRVRQGSAAGIVTLAQANATLDDAQGQQTGGVILLGVAGAAAATGVGMLLFGGDDSTQTPRVHLTVQPGGLSAWGSF